MKLILLIFIINIQLNALNFKVASYNVENLFDLLYQKTEYNEYIPNTKSKWNQKTLDIKLQNISKVLKGIDADIVALQEVESQDALKLLQKLNPKYKYTDFLKNEDSAVGVAILSKFPIQSSTKIEIDRFDKRSRPALLTTFNIDGKKFHILNTHWSSKKHPESKRIRYALEIYKFVKGLDEKVDYIILGDLNSNYNEFQTFRFDKKLNDTDGITGINQILNTTIDKNFIDKNNIHNFNKRVHYNTWLELSTHERFSYKFRKQNNTPDNIILSPALFDNTNIDYIDKSFYVYKPKHLYSNGKINRWIIKGKGRVHLAKGYSDHLPIVATFTTNKIKHKIDHTKNTNSISTLYDLDTVQNYKIKDAVVIYKFANNAIIKQKNDRAIYLYNCAKDLQVGNIYDLSVSKLDSFYGLKEIKQIDSIRFKKKDEATKYFLDAEKTDIFNPKYQNEIITNLSGIYKEGFLYFKDKKIRLYAKDKKLLPNEGQNVTITAAHLGVFKNKPQIILHKKSDYK